MAEFVALDCWIELDGVVLSNRCSALQFGGVRDLPEATTFGDSFRRYLPGLKDINTSMSFNADYDAAEVDDTLFTPWDDGTAIDVNMRPDADTLGPTNPEYQTSQYVENYGILNASVGQVAKNEVSFKNATGTVTRAVA